MKKIASTHFKIVVSLLFISAVTACSSNPVIDLRQVDTTTLKKSNPVNTKNWHHGSENCESSKAPLFDHFVYDSTTFILRQNKCTTYEAPFIYVLVGTNSIAVIDTGAVEDNESKLLAMIKELAKANEKEVENKEIIVLHTHSHSDHTKGDQQFHRYTNSKVIAPSETGLKSLGFNYAVNNQHQITLEFGNRTLSLFRIPGHQEESIAIYDSSTRWLLTGDTVYPGNIYVKNWNSYKKSIKKLADFISENEVSLVLGSHIEMTSSAGEYYSIGTTYQPDEKALGLTGEHLKLLNTEIQKTNEPSVMIFNDFVITPMSGFQKSLSNIVKAMRE